MPTALLTFLLCLVYATIRYNVCKGVPWEQWPTYVTNKAFALGALILLVVLLWRRQRPGAGSLHGWIGAFIAIHVMLSLCLMNPVAYPKYYAEGQLILVAALSWLLGGIATTGVWKSCRPCESGDGSWRLLGVMGLLVGVHAALLGYGGWFTPEKWPGSMVPITLISFLCGVAALALGMRSSRAVPAAT